VIMVADEEAIKSQIFNMGREFRESLVTSALLWFSENSNLHERRW